MLFYMLYKVSAMARRSRSSGVRGAHAPEVTFPTPASSTMELAVGRQPAEDATVLTRNPTASQQLPGVAVESY